MSSQKVNLKIAAEEIKEILRKHNLAGAVSLHTPGHGEFFLHLNPTYSCAYVYNENELRFYSKRTDYASFDEQMRKQADTSNMLKILSEITAINFSNLYESSQSLDGLVNAEHH